MTEPIITKEPEKVTKWIKWTAFLTSLIWLAVFLVIIILSREQIQEQNNAYMNNLTNTNMIQGYITGYKDCGESITTLVNKSKNTCQVITARVNNEIIGLIPISCINNSREE